MSRYGPGVLPVPRTTLADALVDGVQAYLGTRALRRREGFEDAQEARAANADTRADRFVAIQEGDAARRADAFAFEQTRRPVVQAQDAVGLYNAGVETPRDNMGVPHDGIVVEGTNYFLRPDQTTRGQREQARTDRMALANLQRATALESWLLRGRTAENVARIRGEATVRGAQVRASTRGTGGTSGAQSAANLRALVGSKRMQQAQLDRSINDVTEELLLDPENTEAQQRLAELEDMRATLNADLAAGEAELARTSGVDLPSMGTRPAPPTNQPSARTASVNAIVQEEMRLRDAAIARGADRAAAERRFSERVKQRTGGR